jgi:DNA-binding Lrp family transcriptional regulator
MNLNIKPDDKDRIIIDLFNKRPNISQAEIAKQLHLSQPSVALRIKKLKDRGLIEQIIGINPLKVGLYMIKVDVSTNNPNKFLDIYRNCPFFLNGFTVSGKNNLSLLFIDEDISSIESKVNRHLRGDKDVQNVELNVISSSIKDLVYPVRVRFDSNEKPDCGWDYQCKDCPNFKDNRCFGCPFKDEYKGSFWQKKDII